MDRLYIYIGILILIIFFLIWLFEYTNGKYEKKCKEYKALERNAERLQREHNTLSLKYLAQKEALENAGTISNAKH